MRGGRHHGEDQAAYFSHLTERFIVIHMIFINHHYYESVHSIEVGYVAWK